MFPFIFNQLVGFPNVMNTGSRHAHERLVRDCNNYPSCQQRLCFQGKLCSPLSVPVALVTQLEGSVGLENIFECASLGVLNTSR